MRGEMGYLWFVGCFVLVTIDTQVQGREKGRWEEWGKYSPCSRSCGGGVQQRVRRCIRGRSHMNGLCAGPGVEYSSCNTQQCSAGSHDFRAAQCSRYNKVKVNGLNKLHTWKPYTDENNKCVLKCQSVEDSNIIKEFAQRVVDGTNCDNVDSFGICVAGVCQAVGCDRVIGSFMKEDKCRVCGGDGTTCQTIAAIFDTQNLKVGLNKIVTIPAGSTSIVVREITNSNSYLVVKNGVGNYYINGWRKNTEDNSATDIAGTTIRYIKSPQNPDEPETLTALGPTNETLHFELMLRDSNPGIQYEYSLQKSLVHEAENPRLRYIWINGVWTRCSKSCGKGLQLRAVSCIDRQSGVAISNDLCDIRLKPDGRRVCTQQDCPEDRIGYSWVLGHWGECSSDCGIGEQTQLAYCQEKGTMGKAIYTDDQLCLRYVGPKPVLKRVCQGDISCPHWAMGPWQECSVTCGYGVQTRYISCQEEPSNDDEEPRMRPEEMCAHEKRPQRQQLCTLSPCYDGSNGEYIEFKEVEEVDVDCSVTLYGCCDDGKTRADNWNKDNCPNSRVLKANRAAALNAGYESTSQTPDPTSQTQTRTEKTGSESQTPRQGSYPSNITFVTDQDNQGSVILSWQAPTVPDGNITGYMIYYSTDRQKDMGGWIVKAVVSSRLSTIISNLQADTTYYFRIQSRNRYSYSPLTDIVTYRSPKVLTGNHTTALNTGYENTSEAPDPNSQTQNRTEKIGSKEELYPHNITFVTDRDNQGSVILSWQAPTVSDGNITDYVIRYTEGGLWIQKYVIGNTLSTSITDLKADTTYFFRIQAVTREGTGPWSDQATYRTPKVLKGNDTAALNAGYESTSEAPDPNSQTQNRTEKTRQESYPHNITFVTDRDNQGSVILSWQAPTVSDGNITDYVIRYTEGGPWIQKYRIGNTLSTSITDLKADTTYFFRIQAVTREGTGPRSDQATYRTPKDCETSRFGCCSDNVTPADGPNEEGCPDESELTVERVCGDYGCCKDGVTQATGPNHAGCPDERVGYTGHGYRRDCSNVNSIYGCCSDGKTLATGPGGQGCPVNYGSFDAASCALAKDRGSCSHNFTVQWYYDTDSSGCKQFWYGGCGGNQNRFVDQKKCEESCMNVQEEDICKLPASMGPCRASHQRYYYDYKHKQCRMFTYGGCRGNQNRFRSRADCDRKCSDSNYIYVEEEVSETMACENSIYKCCPDGVTAATGPSYRGCTRGCRESDYGCCDDGVTAAQGPNEEGCDIVSSGDEPCEETFFGCCNDGVTTALSADKRGCLDYLPEIQPTVEETVKILEDVCMLKKDYGERCNNTIRWYYNDEEKRCKRFWYGGCAGNDNNFMNDQECKSECVMKRETRTRPRPIPTPAPTPAPTRAPTRAPTPAPSSDPCQQPRIVGLCRKSIDRYYYDQRDGRCHLFQYGGCYGNDNNFVTQEECENRCNVYSLTTALPMTTVAPIFYTTLPTPTRRPQVVDAGEAAVVLTGTEYVQIGTALRLACRATGGDPLTYNVMWYKDRKVIKRGDDDQLVINTQRMADGRGVLSELTVQYGRREDAGTYICRGYPHGNLKSLRVHIQQGVVEEKVEKPEKEKPVISVPTNTSTTTDPRVVCLQPAQSGNCYANFPRWHYDHLDGRCKQFTYGGCGPNENNFETETDCQNYCRPELICRMSAQRGKCRANIERFFYDVTAGNCRSFSYGGCDGNLNNFKSLEACTRFCGRRDTQTGTGSGTRPQTGSDVCRLSRDGGTCEGYEILWYYEETYERCTRFIYTGCGGNDNRFATEAECSERCERREMTTLSPITRAPITRAPVTRAPVTRAPITRAPITRAPVTRAPFTRAPITRAPIVVTQGSNLATCTLARDRGRLCGNWTILWYFNTENQRCDRFYYGQCGGNANRFETEAECRAECLITTTQVPTTTRRPYFTRRPILPGVTRRPILPGVTRRPILPGVTRRPILPGVTRQPVLPGVSRRRGDCRYSTFGCCGDGQTPASDTLKTNCYDEPNVIERQADGNYKIFTSAGRRVSFNCQLQESNPGRVQWFKQRFPVITGPNFVDYRNGTLVINAVTEEDNGEYSCQIGEGNNVPLVQTFVVQVRTPLRILPGPKMIAIKPAENAFLHCQAHGSPKPRVTWYQDGRPIKSMGRYNVYNNGTMIILSAKAKDMGYYECRAENGVGGTTRRTIKLEVRETVTARIERHSGKVNEGDEIRLKCVATGFPRPILSWKKDMEDLVESSNVFVRGMEVIIRQATIDDSGVYRCVADNGVQKQEAVTTIQVKRGDQSEKCEDSVSAMNCKLIVTGRLCGHHTFSKMCCKSCSSRAFL